MKFQVKEEGTILEVLQKIHAGWTKSKIKSLISYHAILLDGKTVKRLDVVAKCGSSIEIKKETRKVFDKRLCILYEDEDFIAVDKPSGLLSVADASKEETMYQIVSRYVKEENRKAKIFVLHRLDKDTSGVLLFSKHEKLKYQMQGLWNTLVKERKYVALVEGKLPQQTGTITSYLVENSHLKVHSTKNKEEGKLAITNYQVRKVINRYTLVDVFLKTGRKNQIRVHFSELGYPVVGDKKYGARTNPIKRLGLHASRFLFVHPKTGKEILIEAPLPKSFEKC